MKPWPAVVFVAMVAGVGMGTARADDGDADEAAAADSDLLPAVRLKAGGVAIDTEVGHAAPFVGDVDGDGLRDLLVGQFGGGFLTIYRNVGTHDAPVLAAGRRFRDRSGDGRIPSG